jgi:glycopeptide antibiotics resistance protein
VLIGPWDDFQWTSSYFSDVIINLVGFIPLGFFMSLFLSKVAGIHFWKTNLLLTITICFIISLCIELIQVYLPTRSSQLSDLFLNTLGGGLGALLVNRLFKGYQ